MIRILQVDASARGEGSLSRGMSHAFRETWMGGSPNDIFLHRDLGKHPPPYVTDAWIAAAFTPPEDRTEAMRQILAPSDVLITEVEWADVIVIATPMYNYGMPAPLKAWFDQVIRVNRTFSFDLQRGDWPLEPILSGKSLVVLAARGEFGFHPGGVRESMNHLEPHIATCSHYLGVEAMHLIEFEYQEFGDQRHHRSIEDAHRQIRELVGQLIDGDCSCPSGRYETEMVR